MEVCKHCNNYKYGSCVVLDKYIENIEENEEDVDIQLFIDKFYQKCMNEFHDYQLREADIRNDR